jgi:hypothetical protein
MAAGAFAAVMGGSLQQIENAAEIGMEASIQVFFLKKKKKNFTIFKKNTSHFLLA